MENKLSNKLNKEELCSCKGNFPVRLLKSQLCNCGECKRIVYCTGYVSSRCFCGNCTYWMHFDECPKWDGVCPHCDKKVKQ